MSEIPQWLALGGASAWASRKVLGPSLDVLGETLARWTEQRLENVARIIDNAAAKAGSSLSEAGSVPPRVAMRIFEEGSYSDDQIVVEYLGGVLASSRTGLGRDDRGNSWARLIAGLSSYELRHHYVSYCVTRRLLVGRTDIDLQHDRNLRSIDIFVPHDEWVEAMEMTEEEVRGTGHLHSVYGLGEADLLDAHAYFSELRPEFVERWPDINGPGEIFSPTGRGIMLFLWAHGVGDSDMEEFLNPEFRLGFTDIEVVLPRNAELARRSLTQEAED